MNTSRALSTALRAGAPRTPIARAAWTRSYAAAAAPSSTKPPVALFGIDGTYASALVRFPPSQLAGFPPGTSVPGIQWLDERLPRTDES